MRATFVREIDMFQDKLQNRIYAMAIPSIGPGKLYSQRHPVWNIIDQFLPEISNNIEVQLKEEAWNEIKKDVV